MALGIRKLEYTYIIDNYSSRYRLKKFQINATFTWNIACSER